MRDATGGSIISGTDSDFGGGYTFTLTETTTVYFNICIANGTPMNNVVFYPQIEFGSTATTYESHSSTTILIDFQDKFLRSLPDDTHDELMVDAEGNVKLIKRVAHVEVNNQSQGISADDVTVSETSMTRFRIQLSANDFPAFYYDEIESQWNVLSNQYCTNGGDEMNAACEQETEPANESQGTVLVDEDVTTPEGQPESEAQPQPEPETTPQGEADDSPVADKE